ncbi:MAG: hypothetical protein HY720_04795 [Planctomycetes bacterium]|nr:hypothetical protein [Planctomycetota bacterium]
MTDAKPIEELLEDLGARPTEARFRPTIYYNEDRDTLEVYLTRDPHVVERVNPLFSVFVATEDRHRVVGLAIKNIRRHFGEAGLSTLVVEAGRKAGRAKLRLLLLGALFATEVTMTRGTTATEPTGENRILSVLREFGDAEFDLGELEVALR